MKILKVLFVHPNFPGQFKILLQELSKIPNVELAFITRKPDAAMDGVLVSIYELPEIDNQETHRYLRGANANIFESQEVTKAALAIKNQHQFVPDLVVGHIGWAGTVFMKDVFPDCKIIGYCEWFYRPEADWDSFVGKEQLSLEKKASIRMRNVSTLLGLDSMDVGVSPMHWQRSTHPETAQSNIQVIHEGIDTDVCRPKTATNLKVPGANLAKGAKIVTYISRALEPARGFFSFMEAVEQLCKKDKELQFVVVGRERAAYSPGTGDGPSYKEQALERFKCDWSRIHFTGKLSYQHYLEVLCNSTVHVYLSSPLFLSWSMLEAMSCGCVIVGSDNAPVTEVIQQDQNGRLVPFFDANKIAIEVENLLNDPASRQRLSQAARQTILEKYDSKKCVQQWKELVLRVVNEDI